EELELLTTVADMIGAHWERLRTQEQLADLLAAKDAFLASVSHELRTPLTVVVGLSSELRDDPDRHDPDAVREFIATIAQQSADLADIVDDLLVAARVDDDIHMNASRIDLGIEAGSVVETLGMAGVVIAGNAVAWADPMRVRQIIRNLLTNAQRYGGSNVEVELTVIAEKAILRVIDDGPGADDSITEVLFEPYQIGHRKSTQPDAIGLGLSISKRLATLMGGDLRYAREGDRTVFALALPRQA
ncbi:MAG: HAMP domain-containing histidine kinase, partial [Acidimicrobiia bacterium]|nr:HAMP domain-containing histidine kinase [Acidimicrobiia bacterium]